MRKIWCNVEHDLEDHSDDRWRLNNGKVVGYAGDNARGRVVSVEVMDGVPAGFKRYDSEQEGEREGGQLPGGLSPRARRIPEGLPEHRADHITETDEGCGTFVGAAEF